jgi:hypothetical protein
MTSHSKPTGQYVLQDICPYLGLTAEVFLKKHYLPQIFKERIKSHMI